jgi:hypothetical protein
MSPKRGEQVPQPAQGDDWELRFDNAEAAKGWQDLETAAATNLRKAWEAMRHSPDRSTDTQRHTPLKGGLAYVNRNGRALPQWQIEVTSGGRIWYLLDEDRHTVWVTYASTRHPKETDR